MPFASGIHYTINHPVDNSRPPLILIHGAGGNLLSWHPYLRRLANVNVYALDLPGHGKSQGESRASIEAYANDVLAFMQALGLETGILAGLSMGSGIALTLVLKYPHMFKGLSVLGGGAKLRVAKSILAMTENPKTFSSAVETINTNCFSDYASQGLVQLSRQNMLNMTPANLAADFHACNQFDVSDELRRIQIPTLIICGADDKMTPPKLSQSLCQQISNSELHILEKTGHMVTLEQPEIVANLLTRFIEKVTPLP